MHCGRTSGVSEVDEQRAAPAIAAGALASAADTVPVAVLGNTSPRNWLNRHLYW